MLQSSHRGQHSRPSRRRWSNWTRSLPIRMMRLGISRWPASCERCKKTNWFKSSRFKLNSTISRLWKTCPQTSLRSFRKQCLRIPHRQILTSLLKQRLELPSPQQQMITIVNLTSRKIDLDPVDLRSSIRGPNLMGLHPITITIIV